MIELPMGLHESNEPEDWSQDSSVSILMGYRLDGHGSIRAIFFSSLQQSDWLWGPSNGYLGLFPWGAKWLRREADHSHPSSAKVFMA
jgi:hypothetical protein